MSNFINTLRPPNNFIFLLLRMKCKMTQGKDCIIKISNILNFQLFYYHNAYK